jgi:hypothetical protein
VKYWKYAFRVFQRFNREMGLTEKNSNAWTEAELAAYLARFNRAAVRAPDLESNPGDGHAPKDAPEKVCQRFNIVVHHRSRRLADATGRSHKAAVDGIVRGGLLPDDSPVYVKEIKETFEQRNNEETVIEIWCLTLPDD